jgi:hypothetical protein
MSYRFGTAVLVALALFFLLTAVSSDLFPVGFANSLGLQVANAGGLNEIRAQYGGFFLAAAIVTIVALARKLPRQVAFVLAITIFGGLFAGRLVSLVTNGGIAGFPQQIVLLYGIDGLGLTLALVALLTQPSPKSSG